MEQKNIVKNHCDSLFHVITWLDKLNSRRSIEILLNNDFITSALQWMLLLRPTPVSALPNAISARGIQSTHRLVMVMLCYGVLCKGY